jgi:thioesterase domain-containing protein
MNRTTHITPDQFLEEELLRTIPLTRAMQLRVQEFSGDGLELRAPLAPNVNDKGCVFGGSMASLMTLACWGLARLALRERDFEPDIYVQDSQIEYLAPVWGGLQVRALAAQGHTLADFVEMYAQRGKARITLLASIDWDGQTAARMHARFVAKRRQENTE